MILTEIQSNFDFQPTPAKYGLLLCIMYVCYFQSLINDIQGKFAEVKTERVAPGKVAVPGGTGAVGCLLEVVMC